MTPAPLPDLAAAVCALCILLVPAAGAGLVLLNAGLTRSRNAAHAMLAAICAVAVSAFAYFVCGFAWQGFAGLPAYAVSLNGTLWNWIGADPFFSAAWNWTGLRRRSRFCWECSALGWPR